MCSPEVDRGPPNVVEAAANGVVAVPPGLVETETETCSETVQDAYGSSSGRCVNRFIPSLNR